MKNKLRLSALKQLAQEKGIAIIDEEVLNKELSNYEIRVSVRDIARWVLLSIASDNFSMLGDILIIHEAYDIKISMLRYDSFLGLSLIQCFMTTEIFI